MTVSQHGQNHDWIQIDGYLVFPVIIFWSLFPSRLCVIVLSCSLHNCVWLMVMCSCQYSFYLHIYIMYLSSYCFAIVFDNALLFLLFSQSQKVRLHKDIMRVKQTFITQTITPKTQVRPSSPRIMTIGNKGMTDHLVSIGTLTFPNQARSLSLTVQPPKHQRNPSSGRARRDGHVEHQIDRKMTGEICEMSRFFLLPSQPLSHVQKNLSSRQSLVDLFTSDPEMEMEVVGTWLDRLIGEGRRTMHPHLN